MTDYKSKRDSVIVKKKNKKGNQKQHCCPPPDYNKNKCSGKFCCSYPNIYRRLDVKNSAKQDIKEHMKKSIE